MYAPHHLSLDVENWARNAAAASPASSTEIPVFECRICQDEEEELSRLETPCACSGSLKYAHRKCIQRWCDEKGNTTCEVCQQPYQHGYVVPQSQDQQENVSVYLSDWGVLDVNPFEFHNPRILALAAAERRLLESDHEENAAVNSSVSCCRSVAIILMILVLFRHGIDLAVASEDDGPSLILMFFILRLVGFFFPCCIIIQAMNMLQQDQQEIDALRTAELRLVLHAGHRQGIQVPSTPISLP